MPRGRPTSGLPESAGNMPSGALQPRSYIHWNERTYKVRDEPEDDPFLIPVVDLGSGEISVLSYPDLLLSGEDGAEPPIFAASQDVLKVELLKCKAPGTTASVEDRSSDADYKRLFERATQMLQIINRVDLLVADKARSAGRANTAFRKLKALERSCAELDVPIAVPTYYKYQRVCAANGWSAERIATALHRNTFNVSRLDPTTLHFVDAHIMRFFGRNRPIRVSSLYEIFIRGSYQRLRGLWVDPDACGGQVPQDLVAELLQTKVPVASILSNPEKRKVLKTIVLPSRAWIYNYARWFVNQPDEGKAIIARRYGRDAWENERMVWDSFVHRAAFPLQYVFADHHLMDVLTVDAKSRSVLDRLWLTAVIDAYSRSILGIALLYEDPSIESICQALRHTVWPKTSHKELGITGDWPCFGIPVQLFLDNAWAHRSVTLESLASQISQGGKYDSMALDFRVPYKARRGALIESFFGNVSKKARQSLPGAIQSSSPKSVQEARRGATLLYGDIYEWIHNLVVRYQNTPHSGLDGMTPNEKWAEGLHVRIPMVPPLTPQTQRLFLRVLPDTRRITQKGVAVFGLHYWAPELSWADPIGKDGKRIEYEVRYDPADISWVALFLGSTWVCDLYAKELRRPDGSHRIITLAERELRKKLAVKAGGQPGDWLEHELDLDDKTALRGREKKRAQREQGRTNPTGYDPEFDQPTEPQRESRRAPKKASTQKPTTSIMDARDRELDKERTERLLRFLGDKKHTLSVSSGDEHENDSDIDLSA